MPKGNLIEISFGKSHDPKAQVREPGSGKADQEAPVLDFAARNEYARGAFLQRMKVDMVTIAQGVVAIRLAAPMEDLIRLQKNRALAEKFLRRVTAIRMPKPGGHTWRVRKDYQVTLRFLEDALGSIRLYFFVEAGADKEEVFSQPDVIISVVVP